MSGVHGGVSDYRAGAGSLRAGHERLPSTSPRKAAFQSWWLGRVDYGHSSSAECDG
jgi:hypothetical protein